MNNVDAWKDSRNLDYVEIECPCDYITEGEIDGCNECPYVEEETIQEKQLDIIKYYGEEHQLDKLIEECSELIQAICKWKENRESSYAINYLKSMWEETADVINIIEQLALKEEYASETIQEYKALKVNRQIERMKEDAN